MISLLFEWMVVIESRGHSRADTDHCVAKIGRDIGEDARVVVVRH